MHEVVIPAGELNEFDLPPVCVITGEREGVVFKPVKFTWYPTWIAFVALCNLLIGMIVASVMTRRVRGTLPFTEAAWARWRRGQVFMAIAAVLGLALFFLSILLFMADETGTRGLLALGLGAALPLGVWLKWVRGQGPYAVSIDKGLDLVLAIPHGVAAHAITTHFVAGLRAPDLEDREDQTRALCARHPDIIANWVCGRCGAFMCPRCEHRVRRESRPMCPGCWTLRQQALPPAKPGQDQGLTLADVALGAGILSAVPMCFVAQLASLVLNTVSLVRNRHASSPRRDRQKAVVGLALTGVGFVLTLVLKHAGVFD
jgi:hypothetical protein